MNNPSKEMFEVMIKELASSVMNDTAISNPTYDFLVWTLQLLKDGGRLAMPEDTVLTEYQKDTLSLARQTYGDRNQLDVSIEEFAELIKVAAKFARYETKETAIEQLYEDALDETADAYVVLDHIKHIFGIDNKALEERIKLKVDRVERWLRSNKTLEDTTRDRIMTNPKGCDNCFWLKHWEDPDRSESCKNCKDFSNFK